LGFIRTIECFKRPSLTKYAVRCVLAIIWRRDELIFTTMDESWNDDELTTSNDSTLITTKYLTAKRRDYKRISSRKICG